MMLLSLIGHKILLSYDIIHGFQMSAKSLLFYGYHPQFPNASQASIKNVFSQDNLLGSEESVVYEPGKKSQNHLLCIKPLNTLYFNQS